MEAMPGAQKRRSGELAMKDVNLLTPGCVDGDTALFPRQLRRLDFEDGDVKK